MGFFLFIFYLFIYLFLFFCCLFFIYLLLLLLLLFFFFFWSVFFFVVFFSCFAANDMLYLLLMLLLFLSASLRGSICVNFWRNRNSFCFLLSSMFERFVTCSHRSVMCKYMFLVLCLLNQNYTLDLNMYFSSLVWGTNLTIWFKISFRIEFLLPTRYFHQSMKMVKYLYKAIVVFIIARKS